MCTLTASSFNSGHADGEIPLQQAPNPSAILHEHSKTMITLATALLGLTAAFPDRLLGDTPMTWQVIVLGAIWVFLIGGVMAAVVIAVQLHGYLSGNKGTGGEVPLAKRWEYAGTASTCSYALLILAGVGLGVLGLAQLYSKPVDAVEALSRALVFASTEEVGGKDVWMLSQMVWDQDDELYRIELKGDRSDRTVCIIVDPDLENLLSYNLCGSGKTTSIGP